MNGLVNSELDIIRHLTGDREGIRCDTRSDQGWLCPGKPLVRGQHQTFSGSCAGLVNRRLREAGQDILMGNVDLKPYKQGNRTACDYCPYHAVCGFDTKTAGYGYRKLKGT